MDKISIARIRVRVLEKEKLRIEKELEKCNTIIYDYNLVKAIKDRLCTT